MPKYHSFDTIPAKVFFEILESRDYQLLRPKPGEKDLEQIFISIYDERFLKSGNKNAEQYIKLTNNIKIYEARIYQIKSILHFLLYTKTTKEIRYNWLDYLKDKHKIKIDREKPFVAEVERVLAVDIGIIENDLNFAKIELDALKKDHDKQIFDYYDSLTGLSDVHGRTLDEKMSLALYTALEKSALAKIARQKAANLKKIKA